MNAPVKIPRLIASLFLLDLLICALFAVVELARTPGAIVSSFVGLDREANLPTWYSAAQYLLTACGLAVFAGRRWAHRRVDGLLLWALAACVVGFSLDEIARIHEWLGVRSDALLPGADRVHTPFRITGIWMFLIGVPGVAVLLALLWRVEHELGALATGLFVTGLLVLAAGAIGFETLSNFVVPESGSYSVVVFFEELLEMVGGTFMLWGTLEALRSHHVVIRFGD